MVQAGTVRRRQRRSPVGVPPFLATRAGGGGAAGWGSPGCSAGAGGLPWLRDGGDVTMEVSLRWNHLQSSFTGDRGVRLDPPAVSRRAHPPPSGCPHPMTSQECWATRRETRPAFSSTSPGEVPVGTRVADHWSDVLAVSAPSGVAQPPSRTHASAARAPRPRSPWCSRWAEVVWLSCRTSTATWAIFPADRWERSKGISRPPTGCWGPTSCSGRTPGTGTRSWGPAWPLVTSSGSRCRCDHSDHAVPTRRDRSLRGALGRVRRCVTLLLAP